MTRDKGLGLDAELIDDLNRFADLAERLADPLHGIASRVDRAGEFKRAYLIHQHADLIHEAGKMARYQAREMMRG